MTTYKVKYPFDSEDYVYLKSNLNSIFIFEEITGKLFKLENTYDFFIWMYSLFNGNNIEIPYDELKDYVEENMNYINEFFSGLVSEPAQKETSETDKKKRKANEKK
jgi:hypothetical protein